MNMDDTINKAGAAGVTGTMSAPGGPGEPPKKKRRQKKTVRRIVTIAIIVLVVAGIAFGMIQLFKPADETDKEILTDIVTRGSIQSTVTGSGVTKALDSETITLSAGGTVLEVFVKDGDMIQVGDPLYTIDSTEALAAVESAQKQVNTYQKDLNKLLDAANYLTVKAEYSGILTDAANLKVGDTVATGTKIATLVDDSRMKLVLYFNYAYINDITVGQQAAVSIPATMNQLSGTVAEVNYVKKVTPEGSTLFQVVVIVDNPGVLTADMGATATLTSPSGEAIDPYEPGKLAYNKTTDITTKASGKISAVNLLNYAQVDKGEMLLRIDAEDNADEIESLETQLKTAQDALAKAQKNLLNFNAVSPMNGTVLSCSLVPGEKVESGRVAISIADTSVMTVEARIDEINVSYVKTGMMVTITQWGRNGQETFMGVVESVSLEGKNENGFSYFPAVIRVENTTSTLMTGMYVDYSLVASQSDNCLMVPVQAVKYTDSGTCLFVKAELRPDNSLDAETLGLEVPDGFYAVPVTVGLSDNMFAEIIDGVTEGTEIFTQFMTDNGSSYMGGGGMMFG
jgi:multidrug resistance efflux pump